MKTLKPALLPLLLMAILSVSWYYTPPPYLVVTPPATSHYNYQMQLDLPAMGNHPIDIPKPADRLLFWNLGDGRYFMSNSAASTSSLTQYYGTGGQHLPYAESTEVYTDKEPPKKVGRMINDSSQSSTDPTVVPTGGSNYVAVAASQVSSLDPFRLSMLEHIQIAPVRRLVPQSFVTYAVTIENFRLSATPCGDSGGVVQLTYDADVLDYNETKDYYSTNTPNHVVIGLSNGTKGVVTVNFGALQPIEQRSYFFVFKVKSGVTVNTPVDTLTRAQLSFASTNCPGNYIDTLLTQNQMFDSHDPNHAIILNDAFCANENLDLKFRVDFQNDGAGPTQTIAIEDELDFLFRNDVSIYDIKNPKAYIGGVYHSVPLLENKGNGKFKFTLDEAELNGKNQWGYSTLFSDESTRGYLEFKIASSKLSSIPSCNAVCNSARIFFDCNPPVETNTALSKIKCLDCSLCQDSIMKSTEFSRIDTVLKQPLFPAHLQSQLPNLLGTNFICKWYPSTLVSDPLNVNAYATADRTTRYTMVASSTDPDNCKRFIYHTGARVQCDLTISVANVATRSVGCPSDWLYTLDATASTTGNPANLVWSGIEPGTNDCQQGGLNWHKENVPAGKYRISVMDKVTGCYAEYWWDATVPPLSVDDNPTDCDANLVVTGGAAPYTFQWQWDGTVQPNTGATLNDLSGKANVVVTVTDANGCKKVFRPKSDCSTLPLATNWGLLSILGVGAAGAAFWLFRKNTKKTLEEN